MPVALSTGVSPCLSPSQQDQNQPRQAQPQFFFNAISRSNFGPVADPAVGLSWHDYACLPAFAGGSVLPGDPDCAVNEPRVMDNGEEQATAMGAGSLLTEFGSHDDVSDLARMTGLGRIGIQSMYVHHHTE